MKKSKVIKSVIIIIILLAISIFVLLKTGLFINDKSIAKENEYNNEKIEISEITDVATVYPVPIGDGETV